MVYSKVSFLGLLTATFPLCLHMAISFGILLGASSFDMGVCPLEQGPIIWISCNLNYLFKRASPVAQWKRICLQCRKTGDAGLIPRSGKSPAGGHGSSLQCSCLQNPEDRGAWRAIVHGITKNWTHAGSHWNFSLDMHLNCLRTKARNVSCFSPFWSPVSVLSWEALQLQWLMAWSPLNWNGRWHFFLFRQLSFRQVNVWVHMEYPTGETG